MMLDSPGEAEGRTPFGNTVPPVAVVLLAVGLLRAGILGGVALATG
ncbi:hypothetical protein [Roseomonas populi]|uniref:Uncharacterized protein n=1 Tax=Roseomonas populi TaxID=3121582 RepID=A0ABT1XAH0_9PROT|nr:hypothetical protein [Roseomonas pecuniae]MCR0984751.1 hypothetical protein [Roseomonas pecuniae]